MKKLYIIVVIAISFATQAQIINFTDANFKAKLIAASPSNQIASTQTPTYNPINGTWSVTSYSVIDTNNDGQIQVSEAQAIKWLNTSYSTIFNLTGIQEFTNLEYLDCSNEYLINLDVSTLINLQYLNCSFNDIQNLNISGLSNLKRLLCTSNQLTNLNLMGLVNLQHLDCYYNELTSLDVSGLINLQNLICPQNQLQNITVSGCVNLKELRCESNQLSTLNVSGLTNLQSLNCSINQLTTINISGCTAIQNFSCSDNQLTSLDVSSLTSMYYLYCFNNQLENITLLELPNLIKLFCYNNQLSSLDISGCPEVYQLRCENNLLNYLFIKNNNQNWNITEFNNNPNLIYVCTNENRIPYIQNKVDSYGYSVNCQVNSYCSFNPGGVFYTILGDNRMDNNNNGCDINDLYFPNLKFSISSGTNSGTFISNSNGSYSIPVQAGSHTITPVLENPTYFNINPTSLVASFPTQASPLTQNFCVTPNGIHHDVEVVIIPTNPARPGFDSNYTIIYKNKGNQVENGTISMDFNDAILDLVSANPSFSSQATNSLTWNYTNLQPLETRTITLVLNVNSPMETPAVNIGDFLGYGVDITPVLNDEFSSDNHSELKQIVVGSYDPNDKTCIEGPTVGAEIAGKYVHYVIRFENTGTYPAENIVVKDMIDLAKFDVNSLIPLHSSHNFVTRIAGNKVEFIFEDINLPFADATNDGYIAFKIKTKPNLVVGNTFSNNASIYFDYNFPIITNTFTTTIAALSTTDFDFGTHFTLYPNPVKDILNFQSKDNTTINSIEIYNTLGQVVLAFPNATSSVDVSNLQSGSYFVKVNTDLGVSNAKFVKE